MTHRLLQFLAVLSPTCIVWHAISCVEIIARRRVRLFWRKNLEQFGKCCIQRRRRHLQTVLFQYKLVACPWLRQGGFQIRSRFQPPPTQPMPIHVNPMFWRDCRSANPVCAIHDSVFLYASGISHVLRRRYTQAVRKLSSQIYIALTLLHHT